MQKSWKNPFLNNCSLKIKFEDASILGGLLNMGYDYNKNILYLKKYY